MSTDERRLSNEWDDLAGEGAVPDRGVGTTAERAERDKKRRRKRYPSEDRRTRIGPTLSARLIRKLRTICRAEGYVGEDGEGVIASPVIEDLLWAAVEAYERGEFEKVEEVVAVRRRLKRSP